MNCVCLGNEKYSYFIDSMWKDISAAQAACDSIDNTETVKILDVLENSEGILVSGMGKHFIVCKDYIYSFIWDNLGELLCEVFLFYIKENLG